MARPEVETQSPGSAIHGSMTVTVIDGGVGGVGAVTHNPGVQYVQPVRPRVGLDIALRYRDC